jgi:hypothetical protein
MVIELELNQTDWSALRQVLMEHARIHLGARLLPVGCIPISIALLLLGLSTNGHGATALFGFAAGMVAFTCAQMLWGRLFGRLLVPEPDGHILGSRRLELSPEGIRTLCRTSAHLTQWSDVKGITRTNTHFFLWVDRTAGLTVPLRHVPEGPETLLEAIRGFAGPIPCWEAKSAGPLSPIKPGTQQQPPKSSTGP